LSKGVTISKLEALLARIRTRAAEPRPTARAASAAVAPSPGPFAPPVAAPVAPPPPAFIAPPVAQPAFIAPPVAAPPVAVAPVAPAFVPPPVAPPFVAPEAEPPTARGPSEPPELDEPTLPPPPLAADADFAIDVDVSSGTPEPDAVAASEAGDARDSRERLSAAPPVLLESAADSVDAGPSIEQVDELLNEANDETSEGGIASDALAGGEIAGDEDDEIEETPASSRRPVTSPPEERLAELAFGTEEPQPARHTPPPKSGRLPAPPAVEFDADVTGVRAAPGAAADDEVPLPSAPPSVLAAQPIRPNLESGPSVVAPDVIGEAQRFAPSTFLALLDASLSL
jgi:hypothetical protein